MTTAASYLDKQVAILTAVKDMYMDTFYVGAVSMTLAAIPTILWDMVPFKKYTGNGTAGKIVDLFLDGQKIYMMNLFSYSVRSAV